MAHRTRDELDVALDEVLAAPRDEGVLRLVVRRPADGEREILELGSLDPMVGLVGDNWSTRGSRRTADGSAHPDMQLNVISARVSALLVDRDADRALAGDQLHVDMDLTEANLPPGTRLAIGDAVIQVTAEPHRGCPKFSQRFGLEARRWVNRGDDSGLRLRGLNAKVVQPGTISPGDTVRKLPPG